MMRKKFFVFVAVCLSLWLSGTAFADAIDPLSINDYNGFYQMSRRGPKSLIWGKAPAGVTETQLLNLVEGMNKVLGRTEYLVLELDRKGFQLVLIPDGMNIYDVPEWSHLKATNTDGLTRISIAPTVENPILVARVSDVNRARLPGAYNPDRLEFFYEFAKYFLEVGVKSGAMKTPLSPGDDKDTFNYYKHLREAYANAKANNLWPGHKMMDSLEEYFAEGSMIWYELTPESVDGAWHRDAGPVSRRKEMREYDRALYDCFTEIYGEWEYFTNNVNPIPWYMNCQADRFGIDGQPYAPITIASANLFADRLVTVEFSTYPHHNYEPYPTNGRGLRDNNMYRVTWTKPDGTVLTAIPTVRKFMFKTVRLELPAAWSGANGLYDGAIGGQIMGFDAEELNGLASQYGYIRRDMEGNNGAGGAALVASPTAIKRGEYVDASRMANAINGTLTVEILGEVRDWNNNALSERTATVQVKPWLSQIYRTPEKGVYIYAGPTVQRETMNLMAGYIDEVFDNPTYGHRIANTFIRDNRGSQLVAYGVHPGEHPGYGNGANPTGEQGGLYVEGWGGAIAQGTESGVWRNKRVTRYRNEFVALHEMGHSTQSAFERYNNWTDLAADGLNPMNRGLSVRELNRTIWREQLAEGKFTATYFGGWVNNVNNDNDTETISTGNTFWFTIMRESTDGTNNGTWGPINTRNELLRYSPQWFEFFKTLYYNGTLTDNEAISWEHNFIGTPWESYKVSSIYDIDGTQFDWSLSAPLPVGTPVGIFNVPEENIHEVAAADLATVADETGMSETSFVAGGAGITVEPGTAMAAAAAQLGSGLEVKYVQPTPVTQSIFGLDTRDGVYSSAGDIMAYTVSVSGANLLAADTADIRMMAVTAGGAQFFSYATTPEQFRDGTFALYSAGSIVEGALESGSTYDMMVFVKDGGAFDADAQADSRVTGTLAFVGVQGATPPPTGQPTETTTLPTTTTTIVGPTQTTTTTPPPTTTTTVAPTATTARPTTTTTTAGPTDAPATTGGSGSGGGCNAAHVLPFALAALIPLISKKR